MQQKELRQEDNRQKIQDIMSRQSSKKKLVDRIMSAFAIVCVILAVIPLGSILFEVVKNGISAISIESFKIVPNSIREAAHSLGIPKWKITLFITMKSAKSGILTGIVLAISRIAGETAPLIMTILGTSLFFT